MGRYLGFSALALMLSVTPLAAAGYDEFALGWSALTLHDDAHAVDYFTTALAASDLNPKLVPVAYFGRAQAHVNRFEYAAAIADFDEVVKSRPDYWPALMARGSAEDWAGNQTAAIADFTKVLALRDASGAYFWRGRARFDQGDFSGAEADLVKSAALAPTFPYPPLWIAMAQWRLGTFDASKLNDSLDKVDRNLWPWPVLELYRGDSKPEEVFKAAQDDDPRRTKEQHCEANFYVAEWWIGQHKSDQALPLLQDARANCPRDFNEYLMAGVELGRIK